MPWTLIGVLAIVTVAFVVVVAQMARARAAPADRQRRRSRCVGADGEMLDDATDTGWASIRGETWQVEDGRARRARREGARRRDRRHVAPRRACRRRLASRHQPALNQVKKDHMALIGPGLLLLSLVVLAVSSLKVLREYQRGVVFQLGRFWKVKGPGLVILVPGIQQMVRIELRTVVLDVPSQDVISRDNVSVKVNAVVYFRVVDPQKAIIEVENFMMATSQLAQTTLRSVLGKHDLDEMLSQREKLNIDIQQTLDAQTLSWGIKVANVEIKHVDINESMIRAIARQAEAERERRAKVIHAEGELQAAQKLFEAARGPGAGAAGDPAPLSRDADGDRRRQELDDRVPAADGHHRAAAEGAAPTGRSLGPRLLRSVRRFWAADRNRM